ncbi:MAG: hypothetical protein K2Y22_13865 [Candidatus Obscuribacterales bacterium]|nr:hypothetical protein [Candidatus Obscuribacterales bacterium]
MRPHRKGQSIIEVVVGIILIVVALLGLADLVVVVQAGIINGDLAARAARAAANQEDSASATSVAEDVANKFATSTIISSVEDIKVTLNSPANGQLTVDSAIKVNVPFPIPGLNLNPVTLRTQSVGPMLR